MAWKDSLLDCKFRGVVFDVLATRDHYARAVDIAEYPYVDGGTTEDLGARPVRFSIQAVFFGDDYDDRLKEVLEALNTPGPGELIHPVWGSIGQAQVMSAEIGHEAPAPDACTLSVEFVERAPERPFFEKAGASQVAEEAGEKADRALDEIAGILEDVVATVKDLNPLAQLEGLRQSMLGPLLSFVAKVQGIVTSGLSILDYPRAWVRDIVALSNGLLAISAFPSNLMQDWRNITGVFKNIERQWGYGSSAGGYSWPATAPWQAGVAPTEAQAQMVVAATLAVVNAVSQGDAAAVLLAAEAREPTLTPVEIETVLADIREEIESAIVMVRGALVLEQSRPVVEGLKAQALVLQSAAQAIIELRPPLVSRTLAAPGNLRLIAHRFYGDHTRAVELFRLNAIRNPNALQMGDTIRAYAS